MRPSLLFLALLTGLATAQEPSPSPRKPVEGQPAEKSEKQDKPDKPEKPDKDSPTPVTKDGSVTIGGKKVDYKVTTSKLTIEKDDGSPRASIFNVSYIRQNAGDVSKRPVLFAFNGGPGSASVWLHIGTLGPKRVDLPGDGTAAPQPPARLVANESSILDVADLVFVDPVSTGYSRAAKGVNTSEFFGVDEDAEYLSDFIRRWVTDNGRWSSPKFLLGESYGGIRVAGLASQLQSRFGLSLNGVVMLSSVVDFRTLSPSQGNDLAYQVYLPNYAAIAHFHGKVKGDRDALVKDAQEFAAGEYTSALFKGSRLDPAERQKVAEKLSALTSLPVDLILQCDLRIDPSRFRGELLKKEGKVLGRFDARVAWPTTDPSRSTPEYDPSFSLTQGAYSTAMLDYLAKDLGWKEEAPYEILTGKVQPWRWGQGNSYANQSERLAGAMRDNPYLRVLIMGGYADLACPPDAIAYTFAHLDLPDVTRKNITYTSYEAGHMFYLNPPDLLKERKDLVDFINASLPAN